MYSRIKSPKISDAIVSQIEELILGGVLKPGDQLPSERDLARVMDVSRSSLRDGIVKLEARGLLQVRPGTGTCVCDILAPTLTDPLVHLLKDQPAAMFDLLEVRQALEEIAVYYAAGRATARLPGAVAGQALRGGWPPQAGPVRPRALCRLRPGLGGWGDLPAGS